MKKQKTLGAELVEAVQEALADSSACQTMRQTIDVATLRRRLHLTQQQFAQDYNINIETLRQWEQGKRSPDTTSFAYLSCIAKRPEVIREILSSINP